MYKWLYVKFIIIYSYYNIYFITTIFNNLQPKVVTATDEAELARQMERAELENAEVAGDDDEEEVEGMDGFSGGEGVEEDKKPGNDSQEEE